VKVTTTSRQIRAETALLPLTRNIFGIETCNSLEKFIAVLLPHQQDAVEHLHLISSVGLEYFEPWLTQLASCGVTNLKGLRLVQFFVEDTDDMELDFLEIHFSIVQFIFEESGNNTRLRFVDMRDKVLMEL
jgi:hypothetical protein